MWWRSEGRGGGEWATGRDAEGTGSAFRGKTSRSSGATSVGSGGSGAEEMGRDALKKVWRKQRQGARDHQEWWPEG